MKFHVDISKVFFSYALDKKMKNNKGQKLKNNAG
jgi:hypothetical protein